ncbi:Fur family transcriptional regulator [Rhodovulum sulfidophilum]|uniref:Ferric uptake regulation protein n=1 Tax=Rhodovulum sulfidophilum TaxID=35806 RepID=A0A0D6B970_RHOSU|nr:Fur family transcriptional regulator [Rhodovulum sulfidophilum]ANB36358.1 transcriptional repressor [Rhodovulum sulfidophilum DSM 1374]ANB40160.1 transcriptional repressor [Rhodovulum sulfidophilum]MBK5925724.1 transcriptional repressor [Rhodovulum sulfidophilum]MBL3552868.1 transcriptional repressor [Rhodovulum sulfidophilum]MBL3562807.1 transcriptional repressor [Rhodovulum sulfidophilum]
MTKANHESLLDICRRHGLRITGQRRVILEVLDASGDHPDVEELHRRVAAIEPGINIATVYRTMNKLAEKGLIERHMFEDGRLRYEPAPEQHHDHFINLETGEVVEFRSDEIERLQEEIARKHGFEIVSHKLELYVRARKPR